MKKILVFSDSHGRSSHIEKACKREMPYDHFVYCGDGIKDLAYIDNPKGAIRYVVPGNCDQASPIYDEEMIVETIENKKVLIVHGHRHGVKADLLTLCSLAKMNEVDLVFFGHTHEQLKKDCSGVLLVNPGSISTGDYAVLCISENEWDVQFKSLN